MTTTDKIMNTTSYNPDIAIHPGVTLRDTLESLGMSQKELAQRADLTPKTINKIVQGEAPITPETAVKLERVLDVSASFWNSLDKNYQEIMAKLEADNKLEQECELAKRFTCYNELANWGYIEKTNIVKDKARNLLKFFAVDSLSIVKEIKAVAFRRSINEKVSKECVAAWLRCGELEYRNLNIPEFDRNKILNSIDKLRFLTTLSPEEYGTKLKKVCAEAGVAVIYTPYLSKTYLNGATRWINNTPVVQLNLRFSYSDTFWFTFFHELGHILLHGKTEEFVEFDIRGHKEDSKEKEADYFAESRLIAINEFESFSNKPFSIESIHDFAKAQGIHSSIVFGRLAYTKRLDWKKAVKYRQKLELTR